MLVPEYWRGQIDRYRGHSETKCCKMPIIRERPVGVSPCEFCGTHIMMTGEGYIFTAFEKKYFEVVTEIARKKKESYTEKGIPVEMPIKRAKVLVE